MDHLLALLFQFLESADGCTNLTNVDSGCLCPQAENGGTSEVSSCPYAGATVSLQPGMCRMRQNSVPRSHPEAAPDTGTVLQGCRGVRRADGEHSRRRAV